jgi:peptidyl-prolyl cis-trans isomerase SurA
MRALFCNSAKWMMLFAFSMAVVRAQSPPQQSASAAVPSAPGGVLVDQVIAVVNGDLVLESDVDEERRFEAFQPLRDPSGKFSRAAAIERLIDRALILQQARIQPDNSVTLAQAREQLETMRKDIPACKQYDCESEAGWTKFVEAQGFTIPTLEERWRERMEILKFIELRFRSGIRITPEQIKTYYDQTLLPEYAAQRAPPPPLDSISDRIQEILLQQQVGALLSDWLQSLKAQGTVRFMKPGEVTP